ncbi:dual oxidase maturation factor 2-like [Schistocerca americana]|uniref:dual oxidase maturation factor 2-like n=1 Tax=Schistocerca americana TaxID=7009 RepID=UPI001F4F58FE|nr:dual oxidase maturation factor 2-like [Schistocerca americana]
MKGWFDAFRSDGGPTLYSQSNRTSVTGDVTTVTVCLVFFTVFLAFLIIFPGVRKERFTTFTSVTLSLFVGTVILVAKYGSCWHVASANIVSSYRAFSKEKMAVTIGAYIGLEHVNVTLTATGGGNGTQDIDFNERFRWGGPGEMGDSYREALVRGLPFPILTVAEYLSLGQEGFAWGGRYRAAGYYGSVFLWAALASWVMMNLLLVVVPRYGAYAMTVTGVLMAASALTYWLLLPAAPLCVQFEAGALHFEFGWCFWVVIIAGALCALSGIAIATVDMVFPHRFSTILEVDYDTPYDRHIIIEESHDRKNAAAGHRLEAPPGAGLGTRILRRLSKRERLEERRGVDNEGFEMDPPKSPWRYPFPRPGPPRADLPPPFRRTISQDSAASSSGASSLGLSFLQRECAAAAAAAAAAPATTAPAAAAPAASATSAAVQTDPLPVVR